MGAMTFYITPEEYAIAEKNGIHAARVYARVNSDNWSIERAITEPVRPPKAQSEMYQNWLKYGKDKVGYPTYRKRVRKGDSYEWAGRKYEAIKIKPEHRALAIKNGIPEGTFEARVYNRKWDPLKAATEPINTKYRRKGVVKLG